MNGLITGTYFNQNAQFNWEIFAKHYFPDETSEYRDANPIKFVNPQKITYIEETLTEQPIKREHDKLSIIKCIDNKCVSTVCECKIDKVDKPLLESKQKLEIKPINRNTGKLSVVKCVDDKCATCECDYKIRPKAR